MKRKAAIGWSIGIIGFFAVVAAILLPMFLVGNKIIISYFLNGREISQEFQKSVILSEVTKPDAEYGYYFDGWYADSNFTNEYETNTVFTKSTVIYPKFSAKEYYTIFYLSNNDSNEVSVEYELYNSTIFTKENSWETENYNFAGWSENKDAVVGDDGIIESRRIIDMQDSEKKLYAVWDGKPLQVVYSLDNMLVDGEAANFENFETKYGEIISLPNCENVTNSSDANLNFAGFFVNGIAYKNGAEIVAKSNGDTLTITPNWVDGAYLYLNIENPETKVLTQYVFAGDEENVHSYDIDSMTEVFTGETVSQIIENLNLENYDFYKLHYNNSVYDLDYVLETQENIVIVDAIFNGHSRVLQLYDDETLISEHTLKFGQKFDLPESEKENLLFLGYSTKDFLGKKPEYSGEIIVNFEDEITKLYADYKMARVHFDANGGFGFISDFSAPSYTTYTFTKQEQNKQKQEIRRKYYTLVGWSENKNSTKGSFTIKTLERPVVVYAVWQRNTVSVKFSSSNGETVPKTVNIDQGSYYTFSREGFYKENNSLLGFEYNGITYSEGEQIFVEENITINPVWKEVTLNFVGASVDKVEIVETGKDKSISKFNGGENFYMPYLEKFEETYKYAEDGTKLYFAGWSEDPDATSPDYFPEESIQHFETESLTFYPVYMPATEGLVYGGDYTSWNTAYTRIYLNQSTSLNMTDGILVIPDFYAGKVVIEVRDYGSYASGYEDVMKEVKHIVLGGSITYVSASFYYTNIKSLVVPQKISSYSAHAPNTIERAKFYTSREISLSNAFSGCTSLKNVRFMDGSQSFSGTFSGCSALEKVVTTSVKSIGENSFRNCKSLKKFDFSGDYNYIGQYAFYGCEGLTEINLSSNIKQIGDYAFYECINVRNLNLNSVETIGQNSFNLPGLTTELVVPSTVKSIGSYGLRTNAKTIKTGYLSEGYSASYSSHPCNLFECNRQVEVVEILDDLSSIPNYAFYNYTSSSIFYLEHLREVKIADTVTEIGEGAFNGCKNLTKITLPKNLEKIGDYAFSWCDLESISFGNSLNEIGKRSFQYNENLESVVLPIGLEKVGTEAFGYCTNLSSVVIPSTTIEFGEGVFGSCNSISSLKTMYLGPENLTTQWGVFGLVNGTVEILSGVEYIPDYAFANNTTITNLILPNTIKSIGKYAFYKFAGMTELTLPNSVENIGDYAFSFSELMSIQMQNGLKTLGNNAFDNSKLVNMVIPNSVEEIGDNLFANSSLLEQVVLPNELNSLGMSTFKNCELLTDVTMPTNLTELPDETFYYCSALREVELSGELESLGNEAFQNCSGLVSVSGLSKVKNIGNSTFSSCSAITEFEEMDKLETIGNNAFFNCYALLHFVLPEGLVSIGAGVFSRCSSITEITIPSTLTGISNSCFAYCEKLKEIIIPTNIESVGVSSFYNCLRLKSVTINENLQSIGNNAFYNCYNLFEIFNFSDISLIKGDKTNGYIAYYAKDIYTTHEESKIIEKDGVYYYKNTESNYTLICANDYDIESIEVDAKTTAIGDYAFANCKNLKTISMPNSISEIGIYAFSGCSALEEVDLPDSITAIKSYAFNNCSNLNYIDIPDSVTTINDHAFYYCSSLTNLVLPSQLTTIGNYAFYYCRSLGTLVIPSKVSSVGDYALCAYVTDLTISYGARLSRNSVRGIWGEKKLKTGYLVSGDIENNVAGGYLREISANEIELLEGIQSIPSYTFINKSISKLILPKSLRNIGIDSLYNCYISDIVLNPENPYYVFEDGVLYNADKTILVRCLSSKTGEFVVPETVTSICSWAFTNCSEITKIILPENLKTINAYTFEDCTNLEHIVWGDNSSVDSISLGEGAFKNCENLQFDWLEDVVLNTVNKYVFYNCKQLTKVNLSDTITTINSYAFYGCDLLTDFVFPSSLTTIGDYAFYGCSSLTEIILPDNDSPKIGNYAFAYCSGVTTLHLPENSRYRLYDYTFYGCSSLTEIHIPNGIYAIGERCFANCSNVWKVNIPSSIDVDGKKYDQYYYVGGMHYKAFEGCHIKYVIADFMRTKQDKEAYGYRSSSLYRMINNFSIVELKRIDYYTFNGFTNIDTIVFSSGIFKMPEQTSIYTGNGTLEIKYINTIKTTSIIKEYLAQYANLKTLVLTDEVESINDELEGCANLFNLVLSDGVETISEDAFANCTKLRNIYLEASEIKEEWVDLLSGYNCYFYSEEPIYDGMHWHYNKYETGPVLWVEE